MTPVRLTRAQARSAVLAAQGLTAPRGPLVAAVERTGFLRTLGGVEVYLAARARVPGLAAREVDAATADRRLQVVPSVRGCIYLVPAKDVPLSLRVADLLSRSRVAKEREKAGIRRGEVESLGALVLEALAKHGPLTTDALRKALPEGAVRSLGAKGKAAGLSSPLPPALRDLEFAGRVERMLETGRLDTERYRWRIAPANRMAEADLPDELGALAPRLAEVFFRAAGLARLEDFRCWSGLNKGDARAGVAALRTIPVEVEGFDDEWIALEGTPLDGAPEADGTIALLPFADNALELNAGTALFADPAFHGMQVPIWGSAKKVALREARHLSQRTVLAEGRLAGFWDYEPDAQAAVVGFFAPVSTSAKRRLEEEAHAVGRFLAEELGHGRSYALDTDDELRKRVAWVRKLAPKPGRGSSPRPRARVAAKRVRVSTRR